MNDAALSVFIKNQEFLLYPKKVAYWVAEKMLLIADAHFGKVSHFRKSGLQVPFDKQFENAKRLETVFETLHPSKCIFLGDLFHSHHNSEWEIFARVISKYSHIDFTLIPGNHDIIDLKMFAQLKFTIELELNISGFRLTHYPEESPDHFNICGHLHPGVKLSNRINFTEKLPCFYLRPGQLILPSFGSFTGKKAIRPTKGDRVFVVARNHVIEIGES